MGGVRVTKPLLFQSKILCLSLLYFLTTVPLFFYVSFSWRGCLFSAQPLPRPLYSYPSSYGEHKHARPVTRSSCSSPVFFSDYPVAFQEIHNLCSNGSLLSKNSSHVLRYLQGKGETFAGNFSTQKRRSFFEHKDVGTPVPCGFLSDFFVRDSDRLAMERCSGVVVVSAIFGDYDKVRQPKGLGSKTLETVCFFLFIDDSSLGALLAHNVLAGVDSNILGVWRIIHLSAHNLPYSNPAMNGVIPKHLIHRLFPNAKFSIWHDAKLQLTVDPLLLLHSFIISKDADMAISKHPKNIHTLEEAMLTARWRKLGDFESLRLQMETYCEYGLQPWSANKLPYTTDVPDSALIARRHGVASNLFSCLLFNELEAFSHRDQLAFAYVRDMMKPPIRINMFEVEVFQQVSLQYEHNWELEKDASTVAAVPTTKRAAAVDIRGSKCERYLLNMWEEATGDTNDG